MMKDNYKIPMKNKVTVGSHSWIYIFKKWTGYESFLRIMYTHTHYCKKINPVCIRTRAKIYAKTDVNHALVWFGSRMGWGFGSTSGWDGTILCFSFGLRWEMVPKFYSGNIIGMEVKHFKADIWSYSDFLAIRDAQVSDYMEWVNDKAHWKPMFTR